MVAQYCFLDTTRCPVPFVAEWDWDHQSKPYNFAHMMTDRKRVEHCMGNKLCALCGQKLNLEWWIHFLVDDDNVRKSLSPFPPFHAECIEFYTSYLLPRYEGSPDGSYSRSYRYGIYTCRTFTIVRTNIPEHLRDRDDIEPTYYLRLPPARSVRWLGESLEEHNSDVSAEWEALSSAPVNGDISVPIPGNVGAAAFVSSQRAYRGAGSSRHAGRPKKKTRAHHR